MGVEVPDGGLQLLRRTAGALCLLPRHRGRQGPSLLDGLALRDRSTGLGLAPGHVVEGRAGDPGRVRPLPDRGARPREPGVAPESFEDLGRFLRRGQVGADLVELVPAVGERVHLGSAEFGQGRAQVLLDEPDLQLRPELGRAGDLEHLPDRLQPLGVAAEQPGGDVLAVGGGAGVHHQPGQLKVLGRRDQALWGQVDHLSDPGRSLDSAPRELHVRGGAARLREQQAREEARAGLLQPSVLDPQPAPVRGRVLLPSVAVVAGGLDVVAEPLAGAAERVDVARGGVRQPRNQRGQRHQRGLAGLVAPGELSPAVGEPVLGGVEFPQVHDAGPQHAPAVGPRRSREAARGGRVHPVGEAGVQVEALTHGRVHSYSSNSVSGAGVAADGSCRSAAR